MKFALVSTHGGHGTRFHLDGEREDSTSFLSWVSVFQGFHFNFSELMAGDRSFLKTFDLVMFSGHPSHMTDIIQIARELKDSNAVTVFYPEGSAQLYDNSIRGFHKEYYEAWNACDILSIAEEDKVDYYEKFVTPETLVRFIHVPMSPAMTLGRFMVPRRDKLSGLVLVYGDNNPNHPLVAMACARAIGAEVLAVECGEGDAAWNLASVVKGLSVTTVGKMPQNEFMRRLGRSIVHFYPTEWIGTSRQVISCASVGTPCIGPRASHTQSRLFPDLAVESHWGIDSMVSCARTLIDDEKLYESVAARAFQASQFYNLDNTRRRFVSAWEDAKKMKAARVPR